MTATELDDPYLLDDGTDALLSAFDTTIVNRGAHRIDHSAVTRTGVSIWSVPGDPKLGDAHAFYTVTHDGKFYRCHCAKAKGRGICSHITAAIMFRHHNPHAPYPDVDAPAPKAVIAEVLSDIDDPVSDRIPDVTDRMFGRPPLPGKFASIHPHQWAAVEAIIEEFRTKDLVMVDAPTGSGKTVIAELVRRLALGPLQKTAYVCSSIQLQKQFTDDFGYAREIKGRSNYETLIGHDGVTCADCTAAPPATPDCFWCPQINSCPYRVAKSHAAAAPLAVLNTSYFLHAANYAGEFADRDLVIADEADCLEANLMSFVEVTIGDRLIKELELGQPAKVTVPESWKLWLDDTAIPKLADALAKLPKVTDDITKLRRRRNLEQLVDKLRVVSAGLLDGNWVFDDYQQGKATFRPIRVDGFGGTKLWPHGKKWLLMSATIVSPDTLAESLGWEKDFGVVTVLHTFPLENRRVNVVPVASMTARNKEVAYPQMGNAIANLAEIHADERMLVHTVSYELTRFLEDFLRQRLSTGRIFTYSRASERDRVLGKFRRQQGGILLAPSMDRGVDLPFDDCRVVVVAKVPFLSLGSKQTSARLHSKGGQSWYSVESIRSLVQMSGRHVRSASDHGVTYILDEQFVSNIWRKNRQFLPEWFKQSLVWDYPKREITQARLA